jgi:hypothetical protein
VNSVSIQQLHRRSKASHSPAHTYRSTIQTWNFVEVATEAEPLSLSIARARVLLSRLSVFSLLPCLLRARLWHSLP